MPEKTQAAKAAETLNLYQKLAKIGENVKNGIIVFYDEMTKED